MKIHNTLTCIIIIVAFIVGCSGNYGRLKNQSKADSKETLETLAVNWSEYTIWYQSAVIVFDPKDDDKTLLVGANWGTVKDQKFGPRLSKQAQPAMVMSIRVGQIIR